MTLLYGVIKYYFNQLNGLNIGVFAFVQVGPGYKRNWVDPPQNVHNSHLLVPYFSIKRFWGSNSPFLTQRTTNGPGWVRNQCFFLIEIVSKPRAVRTRYRGPCRQDVERRFIENSCARYCAYNSGTARIVPNLQHHYETVSIRSPPPPGAVGAELFRTLAVSVDRFLVVRALRCPTVRGERDVRVRTSFGTTAMAIGLRFVVHGDRGAGRGGGDDAKTKPGVVDEGREEDWMRENEG